MSNSLLTVKNLKKYYPIYSGFFREHVSDVKAVDSIDFTIKKGEVLGMVGESGCGKSTAGRCCIRLMEPTAGHVEFDGQNLMELNSNSLRDLRPKMQIVFQDPYASLNPRKSIKESIGEALLYHGFVKNRLERDDEVADILKKVGLSPDIMNRYPHQFSGGQQQRICIARAVAMKPKLIICDEAVSALDVSVQAQILNLLAELKESLNLSYLFISHDLSVVRHISDRVVVMYYGKIVEQAPCEKLFEDPEHRYTKKLLSAIPINHPKNRG